MKRCAAWPCAAPLHGQAQVRGYCRRCERSLRRTDALLARGIAAGLVVPRLLVFPWTLDNETARAAARVALALQERLGPAGSGAA